MRAAGGLAIGLTITLPLGLFLARSARVGLSPGRPAQPRRNFQDLGDFGGPVPVPAPALPLKVSDRGGYLVDQQGKPFLVVGDSPWSLIVQPGDRDMDHYLADRQKKGFNSILVNLLEHKFCTNPPKTRAGLAPFRTPGDFSTPNPSYFDFAHRVVRKANDRGIVVWLAPAFLGYGGGGEGWFQEMKASGKVALRGYGRFLGDRFKDLPNLVWVLGGDYSPPGGDRWVVTELAEGIREHDVVHLMTAHGRRKDSGVVAFGSPKWLDINSTYSDQENMLPSLLQDFRRRHAHPFVLLEAIYENEHEAKPEWIRCQAYWAILSGACGQFFGNSPIWHFDGPGLFPQKATWQEALDQEGSWDMTRLRNLFAGRPWHRLLPDLEHKVVTGGYAEGPATTARTPDNKLALTYVPSTATQKRSLTVDLGQFMGPVTARWYNPTNGRFTRVDGSPFANRGSRLLRTPGDNGTGSSDWLLVLEVE